jgi:O-antigen/teichoic acid export membrane protein
VALIDLTEIRKILLSRTAKAAGGYLVSNMLNASIPFFLLPILTRLLSPSDYGSVAMFQALYAIFSTLTMFGLRVPLMRVLSVEEEKSADYTISTIAIVGGLLVVFGIVFVVMKDWVGHLTGLSPLWISFALLASGGTTVGQVYMSTLQAQGKPRRYGTFQNITTLVNFGMSIVFVVALGWGWRGRAAGIVLGGLFAGAAGIVLLYRAGLIGRIRREHIADALSLAVATVPYATSSVVAGYADRLYLAGTYSHALIGVYTVAAQLSLVLAMIGQSFNLALTPWAFRKLDELKSTRQAMHLLRLCGLATLGITVMSVAYYLFALFILYFALPKQYHGATVFLPWLIGGSYLNFVYFLFVPPMFYYKKRATLTISGIALLFVLFGGFHYFQELAGAQGVAIAVFVSRIFLVGFAVVWAFRLVPASIRERSAMHGSSGAA